MADGYSEFDAEQSAINRRRKLAETLMGQGIQGSKGQMAGRFYVPPSHLEPLTRALSAFTGAKAGEAADTQTAALGKRRDEALAAALGAMPRATQQAMPTDQEGTGSFDMAGTQTPQQIVQPTMQQNAGWMAQLGRVGPQAVQMGGTLLGMQQKADENAAGREARLQERIMVLDAAQQNAALSREERASRAAESATLRRDLLESQQSFQRTMAGAGRTPPGYRATPTGDLQAIPGGPADLKLQGAFNQDTASLQGGTGSFDRLATAANEAMNHPGLKGITGLRGMIPNVPGTDAADAQAKLNTLKSQVAFGVLQEMRNNSKTGGALGSVSDAEGKRLEANLAALENAQSYEQMRDSLKKIIEYAGGAKDRLREAYNMKHGSQVPAASPQRRATDVDKILEKYK